MIKERLEVIRQGVRKQHIHSLFTQKRILLLEYTLQVNSLPQLQPPTLEVIMQIAKYSQLEQHIEELISQGWRDQLWPFLEPFYFDTKEQWHASLALSNLYLIPQQQLPTPNQTYSLVQLLKTNNHKIINNVLVILFNIIFDHPQWGNQVVQQLQLVQNLLRLFTLENLTQIFLVDLLKVIYKIIILGNDNYQFLMFSRPLIDLVCSSLTLNQELSYSSLRILHLLSKRFPSKILPIIFESRLLAKVGPLVKYFTDNKLKELFYKLALLFCSKLTNKDFKTYLLPLIQDQITKGNKLKIEACRLLYISLESQIINSNQFWSYPFRPQMLEEFLQTDDPDILVQYVYIFATCLLNIQLYKHEEDNIKYCLERAQTKMEENVEIMGFIDEALCQCRN